MKKTCLVLFAVMLTCAAFEASALKVGDPAPEMGIDTWVKGGPVASLNEPGKLYVIEFWATWCAPCRQTIPHLTKIQAKYKDKGLTVIGVSTDEDKTKVEPFVKQMGSKMEYTVAIDSDGKTSMAYKEAVGAEGIPYAFLIGGGGKVLWHGHPMAGLDNVIDLALQAGNDPKKLQEIPVLAERQKETDELSRIWASEYMVRAKYGNDKGAADQAGKRLLESPGIEPGLLAAVANAILDKELKYRNVQFALQLAEEACKRTGFQEAEIVDAYGWALSKNGKNKEAEEQLRKALTLTTEPEAQNAIKQHLSAIGAKQ